MDFDLQKLSDHERNLAELDREHLPFSEADEELKTSLTAALDQDEKDLLARQREAAEKRRKTPRSTQYDEEIAYTNGALSELWRVRALIKSLAERSL